MRSVPTRGRATGNRESATVSMDMKGRLVVASLAQIIALATGLVNT